MEDQIQSQNDVILDSDPHLQSALIFLEQFNNRIEIVQLDDSNGEIRSDPNLSFEHPYPPTKTIFIPDKECQKPDLLATSSDFLSVWRIADDQSRVDLKTTLNGNNNSEFCGSLTSIDWNEAEPKRIGTSSIDTTCTIWDIERETVDTQLIAHDKEVYDIAWGGVGIFLDFWIQPDAIPSYISVLI